MSPNPPVCRPTAGGSGNSKRRRDWDLNPESHTGTRFPGVRFTVRPSRLTPTVPAVGV